MKKHSILYIFLVAGLLLSPVAHGVTISTAIPGTNANSTSSAPGAFIANFYQFALMIAGILAFGVIVFGGILYMSSPGNPSGQSNAKEWIWGALMGLLLLAAAYLILNVVNPQLLNLNLPKLNQVSATSQTSQSGSSAPLNTGTIPGLQNTGSTCGGTTNGTCPSGKNCVAGGIAGYTCE
jgi:cytochrome bd-type quinol oxidase subunit 2